MGSGPEFLLETAEFTKTLNEIGKVVSDDFSEDEVQMVFLNEGYFQQLGYEVGTTLRSECEVPSGYVDYITSGYGGTYRDTNTVVYEFKSPQRSLNRHISQLKKYMNDTGAKFGVLTNGLRYQLFEDKPSTPKKIRDFSLESATDTEASGIILFLGYWSIKEQNIRPVAEKAASEVVTLIPEEVHLKFSEEGIELFADHLARYLKQEFQNEKEIELE
ncbi:type I restriction enzyme HsdR N-terminal domain-containing protein [Halorubrum aethiopicum]|uniref:type I restriction enzyme HsdR N-terminal domain-containing protein n=1 Tax=Halorubrum aethiopicum TaxID=1758255 RepID=UPI0009B5C4EB|nr:type I restriction enzyme HsdR N-terminal domain-containing protein [Halorubrum aethiopicum]